MTGPKGTDARMNQFVPQLMLGNPLDGSKGPPDYVPEWHKHTSWCFGAQYFFELFNQTENATQAHAATGTTFNCTPGETIFTEFTLSKDWVRKMCACVSEQRNVRHPRQTQGRCCGCYAPFSLQSHERLLVLLTSRS